MQGTLLDSETPITKLILNDWIRAIPRGLESGWQILKKKKKSNDEGQRVELQEDDQKRAMGINVRFSLRYNFINDLEEDIH